MYIVNTPFIMRAGWGIVKPWLHPVTVARINICNSPKDCLEKMIEKASLKKKKYNIDVYEYKYIMHLSITQKKNH